MKKHEFDIYNSKKHSLCKKEVKVRYDITCPIYGFLKEI